MSRPSWVEVDLGAVSHNVGQLARHARGSLLCAVVKADGYGHGAPAVAASALAGGARWLAVATVEEGMELREGGIEAPVLLLTEPPHSDLEEVIRFRITPTLYRPASVRALARAASRLGAKEVVTHLKVDTGMHRVGVPPGELPELAESVNAGGSLRIGGVWSHFSVADTDPEFTRRQIDSYRDALDSIQEILASVPGQALRHLANTPGVLFHPESHLDMVRTGLGIYGLHPHHSARSVVDLRPAMRVVSHVSLVARHPAGARPSYGRMRPLQSASTVATLPIGYADGVPRGISEGGEVLIHGRRFRLAGRVTMDQVLVDVGDHPVRAGDQAVLIGPQGSESVSLDEWADLCDTINYEVVCRIGPRLPRRYIS